MNSSIVTDANIAVWTAIPDPYGLGRAHMRRIMEREVIVPGLWLYEVTSTLYRHARGVVEGQAWLDRTLPTVLALADEIVPGSPNLALVAGGWAMRLGQGAAYDAFYLALAERLGGEFWTGDRRLYNRARQVGADFVRFVSEPVS
ncbi:MAG TPA: PIN domain-containing protein [Anaerolineales bacterium]|nr:PIN domain-containing protein [Anaerolineales bacterium]